MRVTMYKTDNVDNVLVVLNEEDILKVIEGQEVMYEELDLEIVYGFTGRLAVIYQDKKEVAKK